MGGGRGNGAGPEGKSGGPRGSRGGSWGGGRGHGSQSARMRSGHAPRTASFGSDPFFMPIPNANMVYMPMMSPQMFYPSAAYAAYGPGLVGGYPGPSAVTRQQVMEAVMKQIEYYFSVENMCKDIFLRSKMDENGWIPLLVVANFNR